MSLKIEGKKCPVCQGYLFEEDEIVWCPDCGAPHHKDCYKAAGHCGFLNLHGTEELKNMLNESSQEQEQREEQQTENKAPKVNVRCASCGATFPLEYDRCPNCSAINMAKNGHYFMFDMLGGVKPDEDLGDGVTATQAKNFVSVSTNRFIPKFAALKNGAKRRFFSWWSFFFPTANFALRKMYPTAFLSGILEIAGTLLMYPFSIAINQLGLEKTEDMYNYIQAGVSKDMLILMYLALIGTAILFLYKLFCGLNFDRIYYRHTISKVNEIEKEDSTKEEKVLAYRKKGGVSFLAFIFTFMLLQYIPTIIAAFIL